jgi:hypothetical protein
MAFFVVAMSESWHKAIRSSVRRTCVTLHCPLRGVLTSNAFSFSAIATCIMFATRNPFSTRTKLATSH